MTQDVAIETVELQDLSVACEAYGEPSDRLPIVLLHGFPDDASAWREVGRRLAGAGRYAVAPYVRGCGPTRFTNPDAPRSGHPAARARDLVGLLDGLGLGRVVLVGQDWGAATAQATCILHPGRVERLVVLNGHGLLNMAAFAQGKVPTWDTFHAGWYQWLFQLPLAKTILEADRAGFARHAWASWSPGWAFTEEEFAAACRSFDNPDWVEVVLSAYRMGEDATADGRDRAAVATLSAAPVIACPTLNLQGARDGIDLFVDTQLGQEGSYHGPFEREVLEGCGHFLHRERPDLVAEAVLAFLEKPL